MTETTTTTTTVTPPAGSLAADPAFAKFDPEMQGAFKNHGWDQKSPSEAAAEAMKSYREAEKFLGVPKDQLVRMPRDAADEAGWKALRTRLGVPGEAKEYDFSAVKFTDGTELDGQFTDAMRASLHAAGVPKDRAPEVVKAMVKFMEGAEQGDVAERTAKLATERDALTKNWGPNMEANKFIAKQAALKMGLTEEVVNNMEQSAGYAATMNALLKIGQMMGEDKFVANPGGQPGVMTVDQAKARLTELKNDNAWARKVSAGDVTSNREFDALIRIIAGSS